MLLSEMFVAELGKPFKVDGYEDREFSIQSGCDGIERLYDRLSVNNCWSRTRNDDLCRVIAAAPAGIIHLPPPLTDEQRVVLMSLFTMGARYMGMSREGWKRCFVNKPQKEFSGWTCGDTQALTIAHGMANCLDSLVSWSDPEPYDIAKALGVGK